MKRVALNKTHGTNQLRAALLFREICGILLPCRETAFFLFTFWPHVFHQRPGKGNCHLSLVSFCPWFLCLRCVAPPHLFICQNPPAPTCLFCSSAAAGWDIPTSSPTSCLYLLFSDVTNSCYDPFV